MPATKRSPRERKGYFRSGLANPAALGAVPRKAARAAKRPISSEARERARLKREIARHRTLEHLAKQLVRVQRRADGALGELAAHLAREVGGRFIPPPVPVNPDDFVGPTAQTCSRCALRPIAAPALCWPCVCEVAAERRGEPLDRAGGEPCPA